MSFDHKVAIQWSRGVEQLSMSVTRSGNGENNRTERIPAGQTVEIALPLTIAGLLLLVMSADQDLRIRTNTADPGQDTINLVGGEPLIWWQGGYFACPFAGDVTVIFVTNSGAVDATLEVRSALDAVVPQS